MKTRWFAIILASLLTFGCTSVRPLKVDAICAPEPIVGRVYSIVPADPELSPRDLRFAEAARIVEAALAKRGYTRAADGSTTDIVISLDAAVGEPESITETRPEPIYIEQGGYYRSVRVPVRSPDGGVTYVRSTIWAPPYNRMVGMGSSTHTVTVYEKRLALTAFSREADSAGDLPQLWSVVVVCRDNSNDLRAALPAMAVAAARNVEADTGGQVVVQIKADDPDVVSISPVRSR